MNDCLAQGAWTETAPSMVQGADDFKATKSLTPRLTGKNAEHFCPR